MKNPFKRYICIKQHDIKDCGAACLATISKQYGLKIPISKIREVAGTDKQGTSAFGIIKATEQLGFTAKGVKVSKPEDIFFASLICTILGILGAFYFQVLVDDVLQYNLLTTLHILSIGFIVLSLFKILLNAFRSQLLMYLAQRIDIPLMLGYYEHVINLPMNFFGTRKVGEIVSRFIDATSISEAISGATLTIMIDTLMAFAGAVILFTQSCLLFGITLTKWAEFSYPHRWEMDSPWS